MPRKAVAKACKKCGEIGRWGMGGLYCFVCRVKCDDPNPHPSYKCRACKAIKAAKLRESSPEYVEEQRQRRRATLYGLDRDELAILESLARCESCGDETDLVIDHDHSTGDVRGMLCSACNKALGFLREDVNRTLSLADYIDRKIYR